MWGFFSPNNVCYTKITWELLSVTGMWVPDCFKCHLGFGNCIAEFPSIRTCLTTATCRWNFTSGRWSKESFPLFSDPEDLKILCLGEEKKKRRNVIFTTWCINTHFSVCFLLLTVTGSLTRERRTPCALMRRRRIASVCFPCGFSSSAD